MACLNTNLTHTFAPHTYVRQWLGSYDIQSEYDSGQVSKRVTQLVSPGSEAPPNGAPGRPSFRPNDEDCSQAEARDKAEHLKVYEAEVFPAVAAGDESYQSSARRSSSSPSALPANDNTDTSQRQHGYASYTRPGPASGTGALASVSVSKPPICPVPLMRGNPSFQSGHHRRLPPAAADELLEGPSLRGMALPCADTAAPQDK